MSAGHALAMSMLALHIDVAGSTPVDGLGQHPRADLCTLRYPVWCTCTLKVAFHCPHGPVLTWQLKRLAMRTCPATGPAQPWRLYVGVMPEQTPSIACIQQLGASARSLSSPRALEELSKCCSRARVAHWLSLIHI